MRQCTLVVIAVTVMAGLVAFVAPARGHGAGGAAPAYVTEIPQGYRDFKWISSAHEAGNLNSLGAVLGNDVAFSAFRDGNSRTRTAPSLRLCITRTCRQMRTTKCSAKSNLTFLVHRRTFSSWSRTRPRTPPRVAGASVTFRTANRATRHL